MKKQRLKIQGLEDNCKTCSICIMRILEEKGTDKTFEGIMTENFPQVNVRHQTTDPGSSE